MSEILFPSSERKTREVANEEEVSSLHLLL